MKIQGTNSTGMGEKPPIKMKVIITKGTGGRSKYVYEGQEPTASILDLKKLMQEREGILHTSLNLFLHFIEVDDDMLLHHYAQGQDTLKLTMILQQRGKWVPETFFVKKHEEELTSFVIIENQSLNVKAGIFKITQSITKDEKKFCEVSTYKIYSDSLVTFFKEGGKFSTTTNLHHPPKTVVSVDGEEMEPIKIEELRLRADTESLDEKLSFNYNLLTTVTDVNFPPKIPATSLSPGATPVFGEPQWHMISNVVINEETLGIILSGQTQEPTKHLQIKQQSELFTFPEEYHVIDTNMNISKEENRKEIENSNMKKSNQTITPEREGIMVRGRNVLARWKKIVVHYGRKLKALFCQPNEFKNKFDMA